MLSTTQYLESKNVNSPSAKIGGHKVKAVSRIAPMLATSMILGTVFIDGKIDSTDTKSRLMIGRSGHAVATVKVWRQGRCTVLRRYYD